MDNTRLLQLALESLESKKAQIESEITMIRSEMGHSARVRKPVAKAQPIKQRKSAAQRKAQSERMKAYWAAKRKEKAGKSKKK